MKRSSDFLRAGAYPPNVIGVIQTSRSVPTMAARTSRWSSLIAQTPGCFTQQAKHPRQGLTMRPSSSKDVTA